MAVLEKPRSTQRERVLHHLRQAGNNGLDGVFFLQDLPQYYGEPCIIDYRKRISELVADGYNIQKFDREGRGRTTRYVLHEDAQQSLF